MIRLWSAFVCALCGLPLWAGVWFENAVEAGCAASEGAWTGLDDVRWQSEGECLAGTAVSSAPLRFTPATACSMAGRCVLVRTRMTFAACATADLPTQNLDGVQAALALVRDSDSILTYYGLVNGGWLALGGRFPDDDEEDAFVEVEIALWQDADGANRVRYSVENCVLDWGETTEFAATGMASNVTDIAFTGGGSVSSLAGEWKTAATPEAVRAYEALEEFFAAHEGVLARLPGLCGEDKSGAIALRAWIEALDLKAEDIAQSAYIGASCQLNVTPQDIARDITLVPFGLSTERFRFSLRVNGCPVSASALKGLVQASHDAKTWLDVDVLTGEKDEIAEIARPKDAEDALFLRAWIPSD